MQPGQIIRRRRLANGLTQQQLALRAGSTQAAISRLERGEISPTFETLERLLAVMGEEAELSTRRPEADYDRARLRSLRARPPDERLIQAMSWNRLAGQFAAAGRQARGLAGKPDDRETDAGVVGREALPPEVLRGGSVTRHETPLDAAGILRALDDHAVDYVVIGGLAVQTHGHPRTTQDLDLVPELSSANLARLRSALTALGARPVGESQPARIEIPASRVLELDTDSGGVDIHLDPPGVAPYSELRSRALNVHVGVNVLVAGLDDLIAMKRASGRPIDRSDVLALTEP